MLAAGAAGAADLFQVYRDALAHDAGYAAARAQFDADREKVVQGRGALLPTVTASANASRNDDETHSEAGAETSKRYNSNSYALRLNAPLFRRQNWLQYQESALRTELAGRLLGAARQTLILRTAQAYFDVLNARDSLEAIVQLRTAAAEQLELARTSFNVGTVTITDVHEAQSRFDLASAQEIAARNTLDVAREALARIIGRTPGELAGLRAGIELSRPQPDDIDAWVDSAEKDNFDVQAQQILREIALRALARERAGHLPTLDLVASYGRSRQPSASVERSNSGTVGVQLDIPLYQGGAVSSRAREAAALGLKAEADLEEARRAAALTAREAYLGVTSGMAQVRALEAARVSSASALEANRMGYEVGVRINIDVLNAQSQLADTVQRLSRSRYDTLLARLRLEAAVGSLDEDDVRAISALLETRPENDAAPATADGR
ncbi:MAG: TolC family outer membrane protein [Azoarcus sp.]|jgi:outer membrane protein|nr:TolC family outer membrane protein [Azoarcus sp.]